MLGVLWTFDDDVCTGGGMCASFRRCIAALVGLALHEIGYGGPLVAVVHTLVHDASEGVVPVCDRAESAYIAAFQGDNESCSVPRNPRRWLSLFQLCNLLERNGEILWMMGLVSEEKQVVVCQVETAVAEGGRQ